MLMNILIGIGAYFGIGLLFVMFAVLASRYELRFRDKLLTEPEDFDAEFIALVMLLWLPTLMLMMASWIVNPLVDVLDYFSEFVSKLATPKDEK